MSRGLGGVHGLVTLALLPLVALALSTRAAAAGPFDTLLGSWGGTGTYKLQDGSAERLRCDAYYTGGGLQLGMVVRCVGEANKIEIRSKLSASGNSLSGSWEERTYNAAGSATGQIAGDRISLSVSGGGLSGTMAVSYSRSRQSVLITTQGIPLQSVNISLSRK